MKTTVLSIALLATLPWNALANDDTNHSQHQMDHSKHGKMHHDQHKMDHSQHHGKTKHGEHTKQQAHHCEMMGDGHSQMKSMKKFPPKTPKEAGQAGFAAIAEIVQMLSDNPDTDWSKVNITALREHLLDMDRLVTGAKVEEQVIENGMRFNVTGEDDVLKAIQNMVPAHTAQLAKMSEYTATTETIDNGVAMIITGNDEKTALKIKGLGFFGLMASGSHHQPHHFMMATGQGHKMHH